jgi:exosortase
MSAPETLRAGWSRISLAAKVCAAALGCFALLLTLQLWPAWTGNPDLSHGLLMPVAFLILLWEARAGPSRYLSPKWSLGLMLAFAISAIVVLALAGLYASVLDWSHSLVEFALSAALSLFLAAGIAALAEQGMRLIPFNWTAGVAAGLWVFSAPIPPGFYTRLTVSLQLMVSSGVFHALHLFGVAAGRSGNVIQLAGTTIGVEEACSGVRSLASCVFCGIFFSAALVRRPWARVVVIALSAPLALAMNFLRSLFLTLLANGGTNIAGAWHDATGYAILGVTAAVLGAVALRLGRPASKSYSETLARSATVADGARSAEMAMRSIVPKGCLVAERASVSPGATEAQRASVSHEPARSPARCAPLLAALLSIAAVLLVFFYVNTRPSVNRDRKPPDLWASLPMSVPGWTVATDSNIKRFADTLKTDLLAQRIYERPADGGPLQITLYLAYWGPGQVPVSLVASHTPDACWPGVGWVLQPTAQPLEPPSIGGRPLAGAESRYFTNRGYPQYVWFWHLYDGRPIPYQDPYSVRRLLDIAWHYGFRHSGDQLFVRVSSNRPWQTVEEEALVRNFFDRLRPMGL